MEGAPAWSRLLARVHNSTASSGPALGPSLEQPNIIPELNCPSVSEGRWAAFPVIYEHKRAGKVRRSELHESVYGAQARASMFVELYDGAPS